MQHMRCLPQPPPDLACRPPAATPAPHPPQLPSAWQGSIPDMHASTQQYLELQRVYRARADAGALRGGLGFRAGRGARRAWQQHVRVRLRRLHCCTVVLAMLPACGGKAQPGCHYARPAHPPVPLIPTTCPQTRRRWRRMRAPSWRRRAATPAPSPPRTSSTFASMRGTSGALRPLSANGSRHTICIQCPTLCPLSLHAPLLTPDRCPNPCLPCSPSHLPRPAQAGALAFDG